jgi:DNA-binding LytR/AlgR family response regulator
MINCIIIEDQPPAQRVLKKYITDIGYLELKATFADALLAINSGIEFLKVLKNKPNVILTTAFSDYALESYEYDVVDYLLKPFSFERFVQAVSKVPSKIKEGISTQISTEENQFPDMIFIKSGYEHIKIEVAAIRFIQSDADYTEIITSARKYVSQEPLRYWEEYLDSKKFVRIHKSYILNISKIQKIIGNQVQFEGNINLPIGRAYKEGFMKLVLK